ncbi:hypothetical protein HDE_08771 [Halotydeus destructor]|nr:hypothetical protein HDE_08771 [Halotydeus destructor]
MDKNLVDEIRGLRELELERRRIISSQIVRRKKMANWLFDGDCEPSANCGKTIKLGHREDDQVAADQLITHLASGKEPKFVYLANYGIKPIIGV